MSLEANLNSQWTWELNFLSLMGRFRLEYQENRNRALLPRNSHFPFSQKLNLSQSVERWKVFIGVLNVMYVSFNCTRKCFRISIYQIKFYSQPWMEQQMSEIMTKSVGTAKISCHKIRQDITCWIRRKIILIITNYLAFFLELGHKLPRNSLVMNC